MSKQPSYRASQIYEHLTVYPERPFKHATSLPASLRTELAEMGETLLSLQNHRDDAEGTTKLLLAARDGSLLEAVVMRYADRATVCVSTQVGCPLGCAFCSTGAMGFQRNLTPGEILDQVRVAQVLLRQESEDRRVTNVVYMGMGEPFLNLEALLTSVRLLIDGDGLNFARRAVSVSTVGIPEGIRALADHEPQVGLALSLHAPEDGLRNRLVPINKRFHISQIMTSVREHTARTHRKLMVEYVLLANVNDSLHHADSLAQLLRGMMVDHHSPEELGEAICMVERVIDIGQQNVLHHQFAVRPGRVLSNRGHDLRDVEAFVDWDQAVPQAIFRGVEGERKTYLGLMVRQGAYSFRYSHGGDGNSAAGEVQTIAVNEQPHRGQECLQIKKGLPHPHIDHVCHSPVFTLLPQQDLGNPNLIQDLSWCEIPLEAHGPRGTEGTTQRTAYLGGNAHGCTVCIAHHDRLQQ